MSTSHRHEMVSQHSMKISRMCKPWIPGPLPLQVGPGDEAKMDYALNSIKVSWLSTSQ